MHAEKKSVRSGQSKRRQVCVHTGVDQVSCYCTYLLSLLCATILRIMSQGRSIKLGVISHCLNIAQVTHITKGCHPTKYRASYRLFFRLLLDSIPFFMIFLSHERSCLTKGSPNSKLHAVQG